MLKKIATFLAPLFLLPMVFVAPGYAQADVPSALTLTQAIQQALNNNVSLAQAQNKVQAANKSLSWSQEITPSFDPSQLNPYAGQPTIYQQKESLIETDYASQEAARSYSYTQNQTVFNTMSDYFAVQVAQQSVTAATYNLTYQQANAKDVAAEANIGTATQQDVAAAQASLKEAQTQLASAQNSLTNAYTALDTDLGVDTSQQPQLSTDVQYQTDNVFQGLGLNAITSQALEESPLIFTDQSNVQIANQTQGWNTTPGLGPIELMEAQNQLNNDTQTITQEVQVAYNALDTAQKTYETALKQLDAADQALSSAKASLAAGVITNTAYLQAEYQQAEAELGVLNALQGNSPSGYYVARGQLALLTGQSTILPPNLNGQ